MTEDVVLEKLEFHKVLSYISRYAATELGKKEILGLLPNDDVRIAVREGKYVSEAKDIMIRNDYPPLLYIPDLYNALSTSAIEGAVLDNKSLIDILNLAETSRKLYQFLKNETDSHLSESFQNGLFVDKVFEHSIHQVLDENGEVRENASQKLREIREEIRSKNDSLRKVINRLLRELSDSYLVRDEYFTQRDGRLVLPIKAEHKRQVRGFIHSESATGQTVYIEPEETLELNNEILSLGFAEKREIERILRELTRKVGSQSDKLKLALFTIGQIDSVFARAKYSIEIIGNFPDFDATQPVLLLDARHPILIKKIGRTNTIPLDIKLNKGNVILITGPNAGGKTVVLKTMGLLTLLALSGIHVPLSADSNLHFFDNVLMDIGDSQSIEDDLSTFSSHLSNIRKILNGSGENSLVLLDEIGTGTDPQEGSALAAAILVKLKELKATVLATTHHGNLKMIANEMPGFQNASMEFDAERLRPTYKFKQGLPGSSYAFEVAERIGFSREFLNLAREYLDSEKFKVENFLVELETKSKLIEDRLKKSELENIRLKSLADLYQKKMDKLEVQKKDIINSAKKEAEEYLSRINKEIERTVKEIKESKADHKVLKGAHERVKELKKKNEPPKRIAPEIYDFKEGDYAAIRNSNTAGVIQELDLQKGKATILAGSIKMQVKISQLEPAQKKDLSIDKSSKYGFMTYDESLRLDIRGKRPEEAEYEVIKFVDKAYASGIDKIEILHGKGTGVLKKMVKEILDKHIGVKAFYFAKIEFGGDGITVVELK